jgi:hypothetical protein
MKPRVRTVGIDAGLFRGVSGVHCSLGVQTGPAGVAGPAWEKLASLVAELVDPSATAVVSTAPSRKVIEATRRRLRRTVGTGADSTS